MCFILSWFWVHQSILHSWGDMSVLLLLWQCSWGFSSVPSGKSMFLTSLIWNTELHSRKCRGIGPQLRRGGSLMSFLVLWQAPGLFSRVPEGKAIWNSGLFSEVRTPVYLWQTPREVKLCLAGKYRSFWRWARRPSVRYYLAQLYWYSYQFSWRVRHRHLLKHWTQRTSRSLKWMWGPLSRSSWEVWLSLGSPQGIQTSLHLVRWKMSLHLRHCRESQPSFDSGHLRVHYNWGTKHRVTLTYLFLREGSSWGVFWKLAYLFSRTQGIILIPR